ncbi:MAG: hypothetical protein CM1200mP10_32040 [Candidatus Neomarinimicrobiota bacterium]|nr:MAG: hypothetical protein CM1200mP10_32040 [Candidatus Neomarinimicrobiota bacterium]
MGLLPAPARYSPIRHPDRAFVRRNTVLRLMHDQNYITDAVYVEARSTDLQNIQKDQFRGVAPYFTEYIRRVLETEDERLGGIYIVMVLKYSRHWTPVCSGMLKML